MLFIKFYHYILMLKIENIILNKLLFFIISLLLYIILLIIYVFKSFIKNRKLIYHLLS